MRVKITECPRDAIQGIKDFIPTSKKIDFYNCLLEVGFDIIDIGSFVSPKLVPQMKDTGNVLDGLNMDKTFSKLLVIIANYTGAVNAVDYDNVSFLGYPFSISNIFQKKNTNKTIYDSIKDVEKIKNLCVQKDKNLIIYLSMAFGNPYKEDYNIDIVNHWIYQLSQIGVNKIMISDTIGIANDSSISMLFKSVIKEFDKIEFGAHLHSNKSSVLSKINSAFNEGCRSFDSVIQGYGGCPMAQDKMIGNIETEKLVNFLFENKIKTNINFAKFKKAVNLSTDFYN